MFIFTGEKRKIQPGRGSVTDRETLVETECRPKEESHHQRGIEPESGNKGDEGESICLI